MFKDTIRILLRFLRNGAPRLPGCEPPEGLTLRQWADLPVWHPRALDTCKDHRR